MATPSGGYRNKAGKRVPSVTTVLSRFKDAGGLIKWAYRQGREHELIARDNDLVTRARGSYRHIADQFKPGAGVMADVLFGEEWQTRELPPAPGDLYEVTAKAAEAGSIAHDLIEQDILTGSEQTAVLDKWKDAPADVLEKAWNSYAQYRKWNAQTRLRVIETETGGVSETYQYGGTFDGVGEDAEGKLVLIDWKTSNAVYGEYLIQLAAYAQLIRENTGREVTGFHLLRVRKESADFSHHHWTDLSDGLRAFVLMRELYDLTFALNKRA